MKREEIWKCSGIDRYDYEQLCHVDDDFVRSYCCSMKTSAAEMAKAWSDQHATEWAMRNYLAVKMLLASQLLLNVASYSARKNIVLTQPYLLYYALLNTCRAFLFTDLMLSWNGGKIRFSTHDIIRKNAVNALKRLSPSSATEADALILEAKKQRELFSYSFPASGPSVIPEGRLQIGSVYPVIRLLSDLAEFNSECLEAAWIKHSGKKCQIDTIQLTELLMYESGDGIADQDDHYRLDYLARKYSGPACLVSIATQGMTEDVFGAWCASDNQIDPDAFDPDSDESFSIFDFH